MSGCSEQTTIAQTTLERQDLPCTYLAQHKLESVSIVIVVNNAATDDTKRVYAVHNTPRPFGSCNQGEGGGGGAGIGRPHHSA